MTIKQGRKKMGCSQVDLARRAGLSLATLQNIEAGRANPSLETLHRLCQELDLTLDIRPLNTALATTDFIALGCPLMAEENLILEVPNRHKLTQTLRFLDPLRLNLAEREKTAIHAWLWAIKDHYPSIWESVNPLARKWFTKIDGTAFKQRRLALAKLGEFL